MTLPTSRQGRVIFPEQREHMASRHHTVPDLPVGHVELLSGHDAWHNAKAEAERQRVMSRVKDNHHKDRFYLSNPNKNWGENELHRAKGVSAHPEKLRGGVFTSKAGQQFGFNRLKERVNELNIRASASFGQEANMPSPAKLPGKTDSQGVIESAMTQLYDSVQAMEYNNFATNANKVLSSLYDGGDQLGSSLIADYSASALDIRRDMLITLEMPGVLVGTKVKQQRMIKSVLPIMDRILRLLDVIAKVANLSQAERKQAIDASKGRDLREAKLRFQNTDLFAPAGEYQEGMTKPVRGPTGERVGTELEQGIRPLPEDRLTPEQARRYSNAPDAGDVLSTSSGPELPEAPRPNLAPLAPGRTPEGSISSSMLARQSQRPGFYDASAPGSQGSVGQGRSGGCDSCEEREGGSVSFIRATWPKASPEQKASMARTLGKSVEALEREYNLEIAKEKDAELVRYRTRSKADYEAWEKNRAIILSGGGVGDGPLNDVSAKEMFRQKMGRFPDSDQELMEFMRKMNEKAPLPSDPGFAPKGGRRGRQPMTAREKRLAGRGKPRETEASRLLKQLDEADDDQLTGGSKKKNASKNYV